MTDRDDVWGEPTSGAFWQWLEALSAEWERDALRRVGRGVWADDRDSMEAGDDG